MKNQMKLKNIYHQNNKYIVKANGKYYGSFDTLAEAKLKLAQIPKKKPRYTCNITLAVTPKQKENYKALGRGGADVLRSVIDY